jgi:hypothetical protein
MSHISELILEELVFEKLCVGARLADLILFEDDLERSISRALDDCCTSGEAKDQLFEKHLEKAWKRWTAEQASGRERVMTVAEASSSDSLMKASNSSWIFGSCRNEWGPSSTESNGSGRSSPRRDTNVTR